MAHWLMAQDCMAFLNTGEVEQGWAAESAQPGHRVDGDVLYHDGRIPATEKPSDTALRNSLCGAPLAYDWACESCGAVLGAGVKCKKKECRGAGLIRIVTRRAPPLDYGPQMRARQDELEALTDEDGEVVFDPRTNEPRTKAIDHQVFRGQKSEFDRAKPDRQRRVQMAQLGITGGKAPDRLFRLAPR